MTNDKPYPDGAAQLTEKELGIDPETLRQTADKLRGSIDAAEYKHVVLGLIFLKYISDAFETRREALKAELSADGIKGAEAEGLLESRDEYAAENVFLVPQEARWPTIQAKAVDPNIAKLIDDAMYAIEKENTKLKNKLPRDLARRGTSSTGALRLSGIFEPLAIFGANCKSIRFANEISATPAILAIGWRSVRP